MANSTPNLSNLTHKLTVEEARKGGIKSAETRRLKKTFKLAMAELLEERVKDKDGNLTDKTYQDLVNLGLLEGAIKGNAQNYRILLEMFGEIEKEQEQNDNKVVPTINLNVVDNSNLEKIMYEKGDK